MGLSFQLFNLLINWRLPMVGFSIQEKDFLQLWEYLHHQQSYVTPLLDLMTSNNPKLDWCNYGHNVSFNFDYILIWFNDYFGEGNGTPLQYSCLENPRDGGAWWAAVYGVARVGHGWSDLAAAAAMTILPYICNCKTGFVSVWKLLSYKWLSRLLWVPQPPPTITWGPWIRDRQYED